MLGLLLEGNVKPTGRYLGETLGANFSRAVKRHPQVREGVRAGQSET